MTNATIHAFENAHGGAGHERNPGLKGPVDGSYGYNEISVRDFLLLLRRKIHVIALAALALFALGVAAWLMMPAQYTSTALISFDASRDNVVGDNQAVTSLTPDNAFLASQLEHLRSPEMLDKVVTELSLQNDPHWNRRIRETGAIDSLKTMMGEQLGLEDERASLPPELVIQEVAENLSKDVSIRRRGLTHVIEVSVTSPSRQQSTEIANSLTDRYIQAQYDDQVASVETANDWLEQRLATLREEVYEKERAAFVYRNEKELLTANGLDLIETQIADVQATVVDARTDFAEKKARYEQVLALSRSGNTVDSISGVLSSDVIRDLRLREADIGRREAELANRYGASHPERAKIAVERADVQGMIRAEIRRISSSLKNEMDVAETRIRELELGLGGLRANLVQNNSELVRLTELETDAKAARGVYENFLQRYHEVSEQGNLSSLGLQVLSRARIPSEPSSPGLLATAVVSTLLGLAIGVALVVAMEYFRNSIRSPEEAHRLLGLRTISSVPKLSRRDLRQLSREHRNPAGYVHTNRMSGFTESLRVLKTWLNLSKHKKTGHVVALTSALPDEGKTTLALCLARVAAYSEKKVVLIDCDLRRRSLNSLIGISPKQGLLEVLKGETSYVDVIGADGSGAHIIPTSDSVLTASGDQDVFDSDAMTQLLDELRKTYDLIILDCPPVLAVADARPLAEHADSVALICRWGKTSHQAVGSALQQLKQVTTARIGLVLNRVDIRAPGRHSHMDSIYYWESAAYYQKAGKNTKEAAGTAT